METTFIYALADPRDGAIRYVGKSNAPKVRYRRHVTEPPKTHRACWIQGLRAIGLKPTLLILEEVGRDAWQACERGWIEKLTLDGHRLTNLTEGGDSLWKHTEETRARLRALHLGKPAHNRGKHPSVETRQKQSEAARRRWENRAPEEKAAVLDLMRAKASFSHAGWHHTPEARARIRAAILKRRPVSAETVRTIRALLSEGRLVKREIAAQTGVSVNTISLIKHGKAYTDF